MLRRQALTDILHHFEDKKLLPDDDLKREIHSAFANSSTISYLHLGRPESIIINSEENVARVFSVLNESVWIPKLVAI